MGGISLSIQLLADREDLEIVQAALDVLVISMTDEAATVMTHFDFGISWSLDNLAIVFSLLEPEPAGINDFYIYYHTVQILNCCLKTGLFKLQEVVSRRQDGMMGLLRLLSEREAIRNEVLLILIQLSATHSGIQASAAKGGIFERLFEIIKWEGGAEGGIVVRDCLELMMHLIRTNPVTQQIFREGGCMPSLLKFLELVDVRVSGAQALMHANQSVSQQKLENFNSAMKLTSLLVGEETEESLHSSRVENCKALNQVDCLPVFSQLCLNEGGVQDVDVRVMSLKCMSDILLFVAEAKTLLVKLRVFMNGTPTEAISVLLKVALGASNRDEASEAASVLSSFFDANPKAQENVLSSIFPFDDRLVTNDIVPEILRSMEMCREGSEMGRRAVQVLTLLVRGNNTVKAAFASVPVALPHGQDPIPLLSWSMNLLSESLQFGSNPGVSRALSECLIHCLDGCPIAVEVLLMTEQYMTTMIGNTQKLLEMLSTDTWELSGITYAAMMLPACLVVVIDQTSHPNCGAMADYLKNVMETSIGVDSLLLLMQSVIDRAKGPSHVWLSEWSRTAQPIVRAYLRPEIPITAQPSTIPTPMTDKPTQSVLINQITQTEDTMEPSQEIISNLERELNTARLELDRCKRELQDVHQLTAKAEKLDALTVQCDQQQHHIQALQNQVASVESAQSSTIDVKTRDEMLVCLGIEHAKVEIFCAKLMELGYDPEALLDTEMHKQL